MRSVELVGSMCPQLLQALAASDRLLGPGLLYKDRGAVSQPSVISVSARRSTLTIYLVDVGLTAVG